MTGDNGGSTPDSDSRETTLRFIAAMQRRSPPSIDHLRTTEGREELVDRIIRERFPDLSDEAKRRVRADMMAGFRVQPSALTPDEDPEYLGILHYIAEKVEKSALDAGFISQEFLERRRPYFATRDNGTVNAVTYIVPETRDHVIFFETSLLLFCNLASIVMTRAMPDASEFFAADSPAAAIRRKLAGDDDLVQHFTEMIAVYLVTGSCASVNRRPNPPGLMVDELTESMLRFVMAHEYAHVLCGHLTSALDSESTVPEVHANGVPFSWVEEEHADLVASRLIFDDLLQMDPMELSSAYAGVELMLNLVEVVDCAASILATGSDKALQVGSHPPTQYRIPILRGSTVDMLGADRAIVLQVLSTSLAEMTSILWDSARPVIRSLHQQGERPGSKWNIRPRAKEHGRSKIMCV